MITSSNTNLENVTHVRVDSDHEPQYVPAGITTPEVINYQRGLL